MYYVVFATIIYSRLYSIDFYINTKVNMNMNTVNIIIQI